MDLGSCMFSVCVTVICLLGAARCSNGEEISCPCPEIPLRNLTELPPRTCFQTNTKFRYSCIEGYVRKAGTSDLARCRQTNGVAQWTKPSLQCIPDPRRTTTEPPSNTITNISLDPIITTTVTAASTSLQTTQSISISASVIAETHSAEPTSRGRQVPSGHSHDADLVMKNTARDWTTSDSTTAQPSNNSPLSKLNSSTAVITIVPLMIICALSGIAFLCYKRRTRDNTAQQPAADEQIPMNKGSPTADS